MKLIAMSINTNFKGLSELTLESEYGNKRELLTDTQVEDCVNKMYALFKEVSE